MSLAIETTSFGYRLLLLIHILAVVVGFGSTFVYGIIQTKTRDLPAPSRLSVANANQLAGWALTRGPIIGAVVLGAVLVAAGDPWEFSQGWVSASFLIAILIVVWEWFMLKPLLGKHAEALGEGNTPAADGLEKRMGPIGGVTHIGFVVLLILMIWKPGL